MVLRTAASREPSPEARSYHELDAGLEFVSDALPSTGGSLAGAVIDDKGYFRLPEPPELGTFLPPQTSPQADSAQQHAGEHDVKDENVCVDTNISDTTVNFQLIVALLNVLSK